MTTQVKSQKFASFAMATVVFIAMLLTFACPAHSQTQQPNMFATPKECNDAVLSGNFSVYEPKFFGLRNKKDPIKHKVVPTEAISCGNLWTTAGWHFVVQPIGTKLRWTVNPDGSLGQPYMRDDCGNPLNGFFYPGLTAAPAPAEQKTLEKRVVSTDGTASATATVNLYQSPVQQQQVQQQPQCDGIWLAGVPLAAAGNCGYSGGGGGYNVIAYTPGQFGWGSSRGGGVRINNTYNNTYAPTTIVSNSGNTSTVVAPTTTTTTTVANNGNNTGGGRPSRPTPVTPVTPTPSCVAGSANCAAPSGDTGATLRQRQLTAQQQQAAATQAATLRQQYTQQVAQQQQVQQPQHAGQQGQYSNVAAHTGGGVARTGGGGGYRGGGRGR